MLSLSLPLQVRNKAKERLTSSAFARYRALFDEGKVRVFYSFDGESISYVAYVDSDYGKCVIRFDGKCELYESDLSYALLLYVHDKDDQSSEEENRVRYGKDYEALNRLVKLGPKRAKLFREASSRIDALADAIARAKTSESKMAPQLVFVLERGYRGARTVAIRIGFSKLYLNRRVGTFLRGYLSGRAVQIQKEYVTLPRHCFDEQTEAALQYLQNICASSAYYEAYTAPVLEEDQVVEFLFLLHGKSVLAETQTCVVSEPSPVSLVLNASGELESTLPLSAKEVYLGQGKGAVVGQGRIDLYEFASPAAMELYRFYRGVQGLDGEFLAEQLAQKVLPSLKEEEVVVSEGFVAKHPILRPVIEYYVGLEEGKTLSFQTKYWVGKEEKSEEAFVDSSEEAKRRFLGFETERKALGLPKEGTMPGEEELLMFLSADLLPLEEFAKVYVSEELQSIHIVSAPSFGLMTTSGEDWFSINLFSSGYTEEELLTLFSAYHRKKKFVRLSHDRVVRIDEDNEEFQRLSEAFDPKSIGIELPLYQALKLTGFDAKNDAKVRDLIENVQNFAAQELPTLPAPIASQARPYQHQGIQFLYNLYRLKMSGILSDDMGLGKTLQAFGLLSTVKEEKPILVVCPKSLIYNWMDERKKWYPELPSYVLAGTPNERKAIYRSMAKGGKACYFVSYDTLRNDIEHIKDVEFSIVMLDEGQYIANANALKTRAVKRVQAESRFVLTGTPVQNSLSDLWSLFDFLLPGYFPPLMRFRELYGSLEVSSEEARNRLLAKIKPFLLGRKKKEVLAELPDKENITISLTMTDEQRKVYEVYLAKARDALNEGSANKVNLLAMMTRLRQICITPSLFLEGAFPSAKIDHLVDTLRDLKEAGRKAIVFSSFVGALEMISSRCHLMGLNTESILGSTGAKARVALAERFNDSDSDIDVMLVSLKAGGTGLNLIGADVVFHLDPWWNLAAERQAEDRAHRIGQKNKVTVFKLIINDSIEEKVLSLQEKKGILVDLADEASLHQSLTDEDYRYLLC